MYDCYLPYLCAGSRVFPPVLLGEPRPAPPDGDLARQLTAASALVLLPGTEIQYLSVWGEEKGL